MKIRAVGAELYRADGRPDMTKLIAAFQNFANALIKWVFVVNKWNVSCYAVGSLAFISPSVVGECLKVALCQRVLLTLRLPH